MTHKKGSSTPVIPTFWVTEPKGALKLVQDSCDFLLLSKGYIGIRKGWAALHPRVVFKSSYTRRYVTAVRERKWCLEVKSHAGRNSNPFPYFLNMQKIFCFEGDGHAWHWNIIFVGCTIADICPNSKRNGLCLKREKKGRRKLKRSNRVPPFSPRDINIRRLSVVVVVFFHLVLYHKTDYWYSRHGESLRSAMQPTWTRKRPLFSSKALQVMKVKMKSGNICLQHNSL